MLIELILSLAGGPCLLLEKRPRNGLFRDHIRSRQNGAKSYRKFSVKIGFLR